MKNKKSNKINKILHVIGSSILIFMLVFSVINFSKDARILGHSVLSKAANALPTGKSAGSDDGYKTLKYKKPSSSDKLKDGSKAAQTPKTTEKPKVVESPTPKIEP